MMCDRASLSAVLLVLLSVCGPSTAQIVTGPVQAASGHFYEVVFYPDAADALAWTKAAALAESRTSVAGARAVHLATIGSPEEDVFVEELRQQALRAAGFDPLASTAPPLWIGGFQSASQATVSAGWQWVDGNRPVNGTTRYTNWLPGEPNDWNTVGVEDNQENYLAIGLRGTFAWNDAGGALRGYVVEYEMAPEEVFVEGDWGPNGNYYQVLVPGVRRSWSDTAREAWCRTYSGRRGHLATITSEEENKFIEGLRILSGAGWSNGVWIGGRQEPDQASASHGWNWLNDEGAIGGTVGGSGYSNWYTNEPNDWPTTAEDNGENYLVLSGNNSVWNDASGLQRGYVVEYEEAPEQELVYRSTRYTGDSAFVFSHDSMFSRRVEMTVEAWVYRVDASRTEAVLTHGSVGEGFFFGFAGDKIRFGRSGGFAVLSTNPVPAGQWTHVAVSYDGTTARFYINGGDAGAIPLQHAGAGGSYQLGLGSMNGGGVQRFRGALDEVRLWSVVRPASAIANNRFRAFDATSGQSDLELVFPAGGKDEVIWGDRVWGYVVQVPGSDPPRLQRTGILPVDLVVPMAVVPPKFDGDVDPTTEYAGAEEMVIRYNNGPNFTDARVYLVHDKEFLYVGIEGARLPAGGDPSPDNVLEVFFDRAGASTGFNPELGRGQLFLQDSLGAYAKVGQRIIENPITGQQTIIPVWEAGDPSSLGFEAFQGSERLSELTSTRDVEFRFHRKLLGDFHLDAFDRLAVRHADHGGPGATSWAPDGGHETQPATWAKLHYTPVRGDTLPSVYLYGTVENTAGGGGLGGITVHLSGASETYATVTTGDDGRFSFTGIPVGVGDPLRVRVVLPPGAEAGTPVVSETRTQPTLVAGAEVHFPGCTSSWCDLAQIAFQVTMPLPAVELGVFFPSRIYPSVVTRRSPGAKATATAPIQIVVTNAHDDLAFYLVMDHCPNDPTASALCEEGVDYFRLDAVRIERGGGLPPFYELRIPGPLGGAPAVPYPRAYRIAAHDTWARPANDPTSPTSWRYATGTVTVTAPPYDLQHGFPFVNIGDGHDLDDYRAAFPDQICNPLFMVGAWAYAPIYLEATGGGECVGMVVTASRFARNRFTTGPGSSLNLLHGDVVFGNGFRHVDREMRDGSFLPFPITPARFDTSNPCAPSPINIWAKIKANHGVQFSSEFIGRMLEQFDFGEHGMVINHADALDRIRTNPLRYQICLRDGGKGHCVQPLEVIDTVRVGGVVEPNRRDIVVWDPNWPNETRLIEITIEPGQPGRYFYDAFSKGPWEGNWLLVFEIDPIWEGDRHVPSIDTLGFALARFGVTSLAEFLQLMVSGDAEPMVSVPGHAAGWDGTGGFSESGEATLVVPQFNWLRTDTPPLGHLPATMLHRMEFGVPEVTVHNRGLAYKVHSSHEGSMFQVFVDGAEAGTADDLSFLSGGGQVRGLAFQAGGHGRNVEARVALCRNRSSYPAAVSFGSLPVPLGTGVSVAQLPDASGVELRNDTGRALAPVTKITVPTPAQGGAGPEELEVPRTEVPAGASMRVLSAGNPDFENMFVDIDLDRDGLPDFSYLFYGETGELQQMTPGPGPEVGVAVAEGIVTVTWREVPGWELAVSEDLLGWNRVQGVVVQDGQARWTGQALPRYRFFRLERD